MTTAADRVGLRLDNPAMAVLAVPEILVVTADRVAHHLETSAMAVLVDRAAASTPPSSSNA
jgi:hypothetical protein